MNHNNDTAVCSKSDESQDNLYHIGFKKCRNATFRNIRFSYLHTKDSAVSSKDEAKVSLKKLTSNSKDYVLTKC